MYWPRSFQTSQSSQLPSLGLVELVWSYHLWTLHTHQVWKHTHFCVLWKCKIWYHFNHIPSTDWITTTWCLRAAFLNRRDWFSKRDQKTYRQDQIFYQSLVCLIKWKINLKLKPSKFRLNKPGSGLNFFKMVWFNSKNWKAKNK